MMTNIKVKTLALGVATLMAAVTISFADEPAASSTTQSKTNTSDKADSAPKKPAKPTQADVASTTASFGKIAKTDDQYKSAVDAHALADALKMVDKDGAFKGMVAKVFEPRGLAIVEFDENYRTALTAILKGANFTNFPALTNLVGKEVVVTGKFIKYRDSAEIVLDKPEQVKIVQ
ncbi:MAG TPA: hypothetical protein VH413_08155 [Verrucomicrobiae bacterium]|jgi:hypothetical protein|nr:hypothetical protein [Verrucomicrobiae bacterium]